MLISWSKLILIMLLEILQVVDISRAEYEPSDMDILCADGINSSNGVTYADFQFPCLACVGSSIDDDDQQEALLRWVSIIYCFYLIL